MESGGFELYQHDKRTGTRRPTREGEDAMNPTMLIAQMQRYFTRFNVPKAQALKIALVSLLSLVIVGQLLASGKQREVTVLKTDGSLSAHYENVLASMEDLDANQRCLAFFDDLLKSGDNFDLRRELKVVDSLEDFLAEKTKDNAEADEKAVDEWTKEYNTKYSKELATMTKFVQFISNSRVYGKCFIERNIFDKGDFNTFWRSSDDNTAEKYQLSNEFALKLFPWSTHIKPVYKRLQTQSVDMGVPVIDPSYENQMENKASYFYKWRQDFNGKGIVIPVDNKQDLEATLKLIKVLRFLGVKLPLQIVHKGAVRAEAEVDLFHALTDPISESSFLLEDVVSSIPVGHDINFSPIEDAWVVNVALVFDDSYSKRVDRTLLKTTALLFSSFEDVILLDPYTLPMRELFDLFSSELYSEAGAYFFPNYRRDTDALRNEKLFIDSLFPTAIDYHVFGINQVFAPALFDTRLFGNDKAYSSATDVILMNTKRHFLGLLLAIHLQISKLELETKGLKQDLTWFGLLIAGGEPAPIHPFPVAVIGDFTPEEDKTISQSVSREICSVHRAYFNSLEGVAQSVLFITDGVSNCNKDVNLAEETKLKFYSTHKEKEKFVHARTKFKAAIIPKPQEVTAKNNFGELERSLTNEYNICKGASWCAYDMIGANGEERGENDNDVVVFSEQSAQLLELVSRIWDEPLE